MRIHPVTLILVVAGLLGLAACAGPLSFAERVRLAEKIESRKATHAYLNKVLFPAIGPALANAMQECTSRPNASTEAFTFIADVTKGGDLVRIAFEPRTNTGACFAAAMQLLHVPPPPPPTCDHGALPIVINMKIKP